MLRMTPETPQELRAALNFLSPHNAGRPRLPIYDPHSNQGDVPVSGASSGSTTATSRWNKVVEAIMKTEGISKSKATAKACHEFPDLRAEWVAEYNAAERASRAKR